MATISSRSHAKTLSRLVVCCALESRIHGAGQVETLVRLDGDRIVLRVANALSPDRSPAGRGRGEREIEALALALPAGQLRHRGRTDSRFIEGTGAYEVYGVEVTFDRAIFDHIEPLGPDSFIIRS